jgi:hypothetical protein
VTSVEGNSCTHSGFGEEVKGLKTAVKNKNVFKSKSLRE